MASQSGILQFLSFCTRLYVRSNPDNFTPLPQILKPSAEVIPYDHSRYEMVILTILSLAEVVVPHLGAYRPLTAGMLYLSRSLPFLYWALVSQYPEG
ncbi:hypothetical protein DSO57_1012697 [Entomophthora muscae]|uniref:Uncharacterized protein n=1 Tax=Entomophthora muscae TaxID=34485 RepID=A0ACC2SIY2_9FUNG|nr:hypothetical protein DSO57_1012697 [Entomophthora muscae]